MAGTVKASTIQHDQTGSPPVFKDNAGNEIGQLCKSWVQFAGATAVRNGSFNVSSITLNATGYNTISFSTSMADTTYSALGSASPSSGGVLTTVHMFGTNGGNYYTAPLTSSYTVYTTNVGTTAQNDVYVNSAVFR